MEIEQQQQMLRERIRELMEQLEKEWDVRKVLEVRKLFAIQRELERDALCFQQCLLDKKWRR